MVVDNQVIKSKFLVMLLTNFLKCVEKLQASYDECVGQRVTYKARLFHQMSFVTAKNKDVMDELSILFFIRHMITYRSGK